MTNCFTFMTCFGLGFSRDFCRTRGLNGFAVSINRIIIHDLFSFFGQYCLCCCFVMDVGNFLKRRRALYGSTIVNSDRLVCNSMRSFPEACGRIHNDIEWNDCTVTRATHHNWRYEASGTENLTCAPCMSAIWVMTSCLSHTFFTDLVDTSVFIHIKEQNIVSSNMCKIIRMRRRRSIGQYFQTTWTTRVLCFHAMLTSHVRPRFYQIFPDYTFTWDFVG